MLFFEKVLFEEYSDVKAPTSLKNIKSWENSKQKEDKNITKFEQD